MPDNPADSARNSADSPADSAVEAADPADSARAQVLESRAETVETVLECADRVAEEWDGDAAADSTEVADPLRAELEAESVWATLPDVLADAVRATGRSLSATPVAAPPYVVATSRGPMLRATLDGGRLVILLQVFEVEGGDAERGQTTTYTRGAATPAEAVRASFE